MATCIALLKAVNVGGRNRVGMAELRQLATDLGLANARTLLQSGNLVFEGGRAGPAALEARLEKAAVERLGLETDFFVRSAAEWAKIVAGNPFAEEAERDPGHLLVMLLKTAPDRARVKALEAAIAGRETVRVRGTHAYLVYPDGIGRSRLTTARIERHLGTPGTGRNWNTVRKLLALAT